MKKSSKIFILVALICVVCVCMLSACKNNDDKQLTFEYSGAIVSSSTGNTTSNKFNVTSGEQIMLVTPTVTLKDASDGKEKFVGWRYGQEILSAGDTFVVANKSVVLTAVWKKAYLLTFTDTEQKASALPSRDYYYEGETIKLSTCATESGDFNFGGWECDGELYSGTFSMPGNDVTLNAVWTNRYTVTFVGSDDETLSVSGSTSAKRAEKDNYILLPECGFTLAGYDFVEWKETSTGETYKVGDKYVVQGNVSFVAVWQTSKTTEDEYFAYTLLADGTYSVAKANGKDLPSASLVLPETYDSQPITVIAESGFARCGITSVVIPASVVEIKSNAFNGCTALTMLKFDGESRLQKIGDLAFDSCVNLKSIYSDTLTEGRMTLPDTVKEIGNFAFRSCAFIYADLGADLETIGYGVFMKAVGLTYFNVNDNARFSGGEFLVKKSNDTVYAFALGSKNTDISVNWNIAQYAFAYATNIKKVTVGKKTETIGANAFEGCTSIREINTDDATALSTVGASSFSGCSGLTSFYIGKNVSSLAVNAFSGCVNLASFSVSEDNPYFAARNGNLYSKDLSRFILVAPAYDGEFTLYSLTEVIGKNSFSYSGVTKVTVQPDGVGSIVVEDKAFYGCSALVSFEIWDKLSSIGDDAFGSCIALTSVELGKKLDTIGKRAFFGCSALASVYVDPDCPLSVVSSYAFSRTGLMAFNSDGAIKTIDENAFAGCDKLLSVNLSGVKTIKEFAFDDCTALTSFNVASSIETIEYGAFNNCDGLMRYYVEKDGVNFSVDDSGSLYNADKTVLLFANRLTKDVFVIPSSVITVAPYAFYHIDSVKAVDATNTALSEIGEHAFEDSSVTSFDSTDTPLSTISKKAFYHCESLKSVVLSMHVKKICENAFGECTLLSSLSFDGAQTVEEIEKEAFRNCVSLTLYLNGTNVPANIDDNAFYMSEAALSGNMFKFKIKVDKSMLTHFKAAYPQWTEYFISD